MERADEVYLHDLLPGIGVPLLPGDRGAGDTGVVDEHVEPAESLAGGRHHALDVLALGAVADPGRHAGDFVGEIIEGFGVDVAD